MTAARTLIDPAVVAQIQQRQQLPTTNTARNLRRNRAITAAEWRQAWRHSSETIIDTVGQALTIDDSRQVGAQLMDRMLDFIALSVNIAADDGPAARRNIRDKCWEVLEILGQNVDTAIDAHVELRLADLKRDLDAELSLEREQMTRAADQAQADATEYRRQLDAASAQMIRERTAHADALAALRDQMQRERDAVIVRERAWNEERRQLIADKTAAQDLAASLNRDLDTLTTRLEELTMPAPTALERTSLCLYARTALNRPDLTQNDLPSVPEHVRVAWQAALPTPADQMAQLRAVALPILGRTA
ncbi:hypothetical protein IHN63_03245 [Deinococcus sp. 6YEL10]|uniref:hypothetical protein n=1 Tax=Deinococcus sp. 6YEL10 TaxID=2745870 RepID=UPI001E5EFF75|nr:hypothetical protein [Deinococcus sp. 6YEL10]MCD0160316.1 hypothetical protein [Deinococcus sp. 6YEL10]